MSKEFIGSAEACDKVQKDGVGRAVLSILIAEAGGVDALLNDQAARMTVHSSAKDLVASALDAGVTVAKVASLVAEIKEANESLEVEGRLSKGGLATKTRDAIALAISEAKESRLAA